MSRPPRVLHVTNRWGGGIATVVQQYVRATPRYEHLLISQDNTWSVRDARDDLFVQRVTLPSALPAAAAEIRRVVRSAGVDVVHAHSSYGGVLVRAVPLPARVVYTPNAYATYARRGSREWLLGQSERLLGLRRIVVAAAGDDEYRQTRVFSPRSEVVRILNLPDASLRPVARHATPLTVVMAGRSTGQKDPAFFAATARLARERGRDHRFRWLGGGDAGGEAVLTAAGVEVTGWVTTDRLLAEQAGAQVHLHSAVYEGSCLSVLDAAAMGIPTLGRPVPGVRDVGWLTMVSTPAEALAEIDGLGDRRRWQQRSDQVLAGVAEHNVANLGKRLDVAYGLAGTEVSGS